MLHALKRKCLTTFLLQSPLHEVEPISTSRNNCGKKKIARNVRFHPCNLWHNGAKKLRDKLQKNRPVYHCLKDSAYFCYCGYVLRIWRDSCFLWVQVPTNTGVFLQNLASAFGIQKENWEIIKLQFGQKRHIFLCILLHFIIIVA